MQTGYWPLFRYSPAALQEGRNPLKLDSRKPSVPLTSNLASEGRFGHVTNGKDMLHADLLHAAEADVADRWNLYQQLAALPVTHDPGPDVSHVDAPAKGS